MINKRSGMIKQEAKKRQINGINLNNSLSSKQKYTMLTRAKAMTAPAFPSRKKVIPGAHFDLINSAHFLIQQTNLESKSFVENFTFFIIYILRIKILGSSRKM